MTAEGHFIKSCDQETLPQCCSLLEVGSLHSVNCDFKSHYPGETHKVLHILTQILGPCEELLTGYEAV